MSGDEAATVPRYQASQTLSAGHLDIFGTPPGKHVPEVVMRTERQNSAYLHWLLEQRYYRNEDSVCLAEPIGVEVENLGDPLVSSVSPTQFFIERHDVDSRTTISQNI